MEKKYTRWIIFALLIISSILLYVRSPEGIPLGLDLQGGMSYQLNVDYSRLDKDIADLKASLEKEKEPKVKQELRDQITEKERAREEAPEQALEVIRNRIDLLGGKNPSLYIANGEGADRRLIVSLPGLEPGQDQEVKDTLRREARLVFRAVDKDNTERVEKMFSEDGRLPPQFALADVPDYGEPLLVWTNTIQKSTDEGAVSAEFRKTRELIADFGATLSDQLMLERETVASRPGQVFYRPLYVDKKIEMEGDSVESARIDLDPQTGRFVVNMDFSDGQFARVTEELAPGGSRDAGQPRGRRLASILDDQLIIAPAIRQAITGKAEISGNFSQQEAQKFAVLLRSGSLPLPLVVASSTQVSAQLGQSAIRSGMLAIGIGSFAVLVFMLIYYRVAGVIVNIALIADVLLLPLGLFLAAGFLGIFANPGGSGGQAMSSLLPTMTLPGIAGLVLTIGMAVDANVLIFERMREEQAAGKRLATTVEGGFSKAFSTIIDANITTLIVAIILFVFGTGTIRGFAVTLTAGIIVSVYTALVFTRMMFDWLVRSGKIERLNMMSILDNSKIDFLSKRKLAAMCSIALIVITWSVFIMRGEQNLNIDLKGGASVTYSVSGDVAAVTEDGITSALKAEGVNESTTLFQKGFDGEGNPIDRIEIQSNFGESDNIAAALAKSFGGAQFEKYSEQEFGGQVSGEMSKQGILAMLLSLVGIVLYITFRFRFEFAMGAIVALIHDILITIGIFCLFGFQLSLPIIAALLTIVGYSVNDTIVVFDRIREEWELKKTMTPEQVINFSINNTLSRTLLTSVTTLLTVICLCVIAKGSIKDFGFALLIGILVGTYSSVFVATPVMLWLHKGKVANEAAKNAVSA